MREWFCSVRMSHLVIAQSWSSAPTLAPDSVTPVSSHYLDSPRTGGISNAAGLVPFGQISSFSAMPTNFLSVLLVTGKEVRMRGTEIIRLVLLGNTGIELYKNGIILKHISIY